MRILVKNGLILTLNAQGDIHEGHDLLIEDGLITQLAQDIVDDADRLDKTIDATGKLVMPGLVNAHLHSYDRYTRGLYEDLPLEIWFPHANLAVRRPLAQREIYVRTLVVAMEMLRAGTTAAYDVCTLGPLNEQSVDTVMEAYRASGMRAIVATTMLDKPLTHTMPYLDEIMPASVRQKVDAAPVPSASELVDFCRWMIDAWNGQDGRLHVALAPSAPQRCTDEFVLAIDDLSKQYAVPWNTHVLETRVQAVTGPEFYGKSIVEHLAQLGVLSQRLALNHGVWLNARDIQLLADGGTSVVHNPVSNLKLKSGIAPVREMLEAGVNVALGCDNNGCNDIQDMFQTMKFAALLPEVAGPEFAVWQPASATLRMATAGGARAALLQDAISSLEVGKRADIVLLDLSTQAFTPLNNPVRQLVYSETGHSVDTVLVNGHVVMENKEFIGLDEKALLQEARDIGMSLREEHDKAKRWADELRPYLERMYWRAVRQDVGINRYTRTTEPQQERPV
jgi:5-methylthioadenosine/S-adenosylhomocysteine deaminase